MTKPTVAQTLIRLAVLSVVTQFVGCGGSNENEPSLNEANLPTADALATHPRMIDVLEQIKNRAPAEHQYFGRGRQQGMRERLERLGPNVDPLLRLASLNRLGYFELLYEEKPHQAIETLSEAYSQLAKVKFPSVRKKQIESNRTRFFLGVAYLRLGETENCCLRYSAESCILPIRGDGVHTREEGSRQAIKYFLEVLNDTADATDKNDVIMFHEASRWLLNVAYMTLGEYPDKIPEPYRMPPEFFESDIEFPPFENVAPKLGLDTFNAAGGAIVDDFDNDEYLDIFVSTSDPTLNCRFFRNNQDGTFTERTNEAGLAGLFGGLNMVQADYNNDGNVDVFILRGAWHGELGRHPNSLLRNNGNGTFTDVAFAAGLGEVHYPTKTAAWADYDNDGDLDLYVANEAETERATADGRNPVHARSQLFRNNGNETFTDVALEAGVGVLTFSAATVWGDFNEDRLPDLFIAGVPKSFLFQNDGDGTFTDVIERLGMRVPVSPFPSWFWDFDNDGTSDLYISSSSGPIGVLALNAVADSWDGSEAGKVRLARAVKSPTGKSFQAEFELPSLLRGDGEGGFIEVAHEQGLTYPTEPMGANFGDLNGDGYLDFYLATGDVAYWELRPNVMFLNQGGTGFVNVTMSGRFGHLQKGHGVCFADIDHDGDQDIYVQTGGQLPGDRFNDTLFENPGFGHHWITIKLVGKESNRSAIGARIQVVIDEDGKRRSVYRHVNSGGSFGCNPLRQNIGLGNADKIVSINIEWPTSNTTQSFSNVRMDQMIEIVEGAKDFKKLNVKTTVIGGK